MCVYGYLKHGDVTTIDSTSNHLKSTMVSRAEDDVRGRAAHRFLIGISNYVILCYAFQNSPLVHISK